MKVFEIKQASGIDALTLVERPDPKPGYGQVLVKIKAVSLNYRSPTNHSLGIGTGRRHNSHSRN
jgi:hypothetical protein